MSDSGWQPGQTVLFIERRVGVAQYVFAVLAVALVILAVVAAVDHDGGDVFLRLLLAGMFVINIVTWRQIAARVRNQRPDFV